MLQHQWTSSRFMRADSLLPRRLLFSQRHRQGRLLLRRNNSTAAETKTTAAIAREAPADSVPTNLRGRAIISAVINSTAVGARVKTRAIRKAMDMVVRAVTQIIIVIRIEEAKAIIGRAATRITSKTSSLIHRL